MIGDGADRQSKNVCWLTWALWALALCGLLYLVGLTVWLGVTGLTFPYQLDYGEGVLLHFVREWAHGQPIYKAIEGYPYITSNYAPLTILLALLLTPALGITYTTGRLWTLLAILAIAAIIGGWVRRSSPATSEGKIRSWLPAVVAALLFAGSPYIYHWAPLFRVDLVGLALTLGGLYAVLISSPRPLASLKVDAAELTGKRKHWLLWLAVILFVAGLYAKQSFIFAPAAALAYLFLFVDRRQAIKLALAVGTLGGGIFLLANALTGGGFWAGLVASNVNPFLWREFWKQLADFFGTFAILSLTTAWYAVDKFLQRDRIDPLDLYLLAALASLLLAGKAGAWENYFFEALAALSLCSGMALARLSNHKRPILRVVAPLLVLAQVGLMWHTPRVADRYLELTRQSNREMAPILARSPDPIVSEDMGLLVTNNKDLNYYHFQYSQLARAGRWDQAWELGQLREGRFSLVILEEGTRLDVDRYQRFTREFLSELDRNYRHARTVGKYQLYEPDPLQHERIADYGDQLRLMGWSLHAPAALKPGDSFGLTTVWQAQQALAADYTAFAHLVDKDGKGWAGDDHQPYDGLYPTSAWGSGEMVRDIFTLTIPTDAPAGLYDVQIGWYPSIPPGAGDAATQERLPVGEKESYRVAVLSVSWQATDLQGMIPVEATFGGSVDLEGYAWQNNSEAVVLTLRWATNAYLKTDYTIFVHLVSPEGEQAIAQGDAPPMGGRWPTSLWLPGVAINDAHTIPLPSELAPGTYHLLVGLYNPATNERLPLADGADAIRLTEINLP